jgi:hypothetical protein
MASDMTEGMPVILPPLDPGVLRVIRSSAGQLIQLREAFIQQLRYDLATLMPDRVTRLPGDGWAFCERLVHTMLWVALYDQPPHVVADALRQVGTRNRLEGFPEAQYVGVAHALVRTVRYFSDDWSTSMGSAWISYFLWIKPHLLAGANQAAVQLASAEQAGSPQGGAQQAGAWRTDAWPEATPAQAAAQAPRGGPAQAGGDVDLESVAELLDHEDEDDDDVGYGQIMVSMTRGPRRERPRDPD